MPISILGSSSASFAASSGTATTTAINTTGASLIAVGVVSFQGEPTPSDSAGNGAPTKAVGQADLTNNRNQSAIWFWPAPATSASHTFSATVGFGCIAAIAFSGTATSTPLDQTNGNSNAGNGTTTTCTAGSVTPSLANEVLVAFFGEDDPADSSMPTINGSFVEQQYINTAVGSLFGCYLATWIQTTATTVNPTITRPTATTSGRTVTGVVATFKAPGIASGPFNQTDWPLPQPQPRSAVGWLSSYNLNLIGQDKLPNRQMDWPLPRTADAPEARRSWEWQYRPLLIGQDKLPFRQLDWPLPRAVDTPDARRAFTQSYILPLIGKDALPFRQQDWPVPRPADPQGKTWTQTYNPNLIGQDALPVRQLDWPLSARVPGYRGWELNLLQTTLGPVLSQFPFNQTDWPLPRSFDPPSRSFTTTYLLTLIGQDALPFRQLDWPTPPRPVWYREWAQDLLQTTLTPVFVQSPFSQYSWPLPLPASTWQAAQIVPNLVINLPPPPPGSAPNRIYVIW